MKLVKWIKSSSRNRGIALIIVVGALALTTVLLLAMFSVTESEYKATQSYVALQSSKQLSEVAVSIVQAQIQNGQNDPNAGAWPIDQRTTHSTQPGAVHVFGAGGNFVRALKLYSSSKMTETNQARMIQDNAPSDWDDPNNKANRARYVDLNEPVVRAPLQGSTKTSAVYFPIVDPRAAYNFASNTQNPNPGTPSTKVEGFEYYKNPVTNGSIAYDSVVTPTDAAGQPEKLRLPMPVEWIYVLQDGTFGTLDNQRRFVSAVAGRTPTTANPIVGRIAFWTDDESTKINVNTASEPTFMSVPYYFHDRDRRWAHYPAATGEYQRYPGHPATVALSAVLIPGYRLDPYNPDGNLTTAQVRDLKDKIYDLAPKIAGGDVPNNKFAGSESGTIPFVVDQASSPGYGDTKISLHVDMDSARNERLYASVDEMLFRDAMFNPATGRAASQILGPGNRPIFDHDTLERTRFFLTAQSRSPEFSIHGMPRICMWPVPDARTNSNVPAAAQRSNYDNMIALCATLKNARNGPAGFYFLRKEPHDSTTDITIARNNALLEYLARLINGVNYPKTGNAAGGGSTFGAKYGAKNVNQLAVSMFDYIRCTNLYDGVLARGNNGLGGPAAAGAFNSWRGLYDHADRIAPARYTYTNQRQTPPASGGDDKTNTTTESANGGILPGHGTVTPSYWSAGGVQGFGRFFTISEIGMHFICTADGQDDEFSVGATQGALFSAPFSQRSGGQSSLRTNARKPLNYKSGDAVPMRNSETYAYANMDQNAPARWWSNFPPLDLAAEPPAAILTRYGCNGSTAAKEDTNPRHPYYHPGLRPENWNMTLEKNTPLEQWERRVQANIDLELFCPMLGWTSFYPEWTIELDEKWVSRITLENAQGNDTPLFDTTAGIAIKSNDNTFTKTNVHALGGHAGPAAVVGGRSSRAIAGQAVKGAVLMPSDGNYDTSGSAARAGLNNYNLASNFITVDTRKPYMKVKFPSGPLEITIYDSHNTAGRKPVQKIKVGFDKAVDSGELKLPFPRLPSSKFVNGAIGNNLRIYEESNQMNLARSVQGPHWWAFNRDGAVGRFDEKGIPSKLWTAGGKVAYWASVASPLPRKAPDGTILVDVPQETRGRLEITSGVDFDPGIKGLVYVNAPGLVPDGYSDTIRTMVPAIGDYRVIAAMPEVPESMWVKHPVWYDQEQKNSDPKKQLRTIHSYSNHYGNTEGGYLLGVDATAAYTDPVTEVVQGIKAKPEWALVSGGYRTAAGGNVDSRLPDVPPQQGWTAAANSFGDFDAGISTAREGPYLNKQDEGNFYAASVARTENGASKTKYYRSGYFYLTYNQSDDWRNGVYMTPNRLVASPVVFGSLPTGVWNQGGSQSAGTYALSSKQFTDPTIQANSFPSRPWQTLLFRPHVPFQAQGQNVSPKQVHPGEVNPRDHYLLDLFFMPVVEPYAISEPLSVAGRVNVNYQILPFTHIKRATGMHALLKGEFMTAIPLLETDASSGIAWAKRTKGFTPQTWDTFYNEKSAYPGDSSDRKFWHRPINVAETIKQFDERFALKAVGPQNGPLRAASQVCEMHLIPALGQGELPGQNQLVNSLNNMTAVTREQNMQRFWAANAGTGDNVREKPYSNLYARITTRSNTFRVHIRAQVVKKARSTDPEVFDPDKDAVLSEYRGSSLLERYIDPNDTSNPLPDYAQQGGSPFSLPPLDTYYQFRVLETKRFSP